MVLSEHNEPLANIVPSDEPANPKVEEAISQPTALPNQGRRLRSIETAVLRGKFSKIHIHPGISDFVNNLKIRKEKYLPNIHLKNSISIIFNILLLVVVLLLSRELFSLKRMIIGDVLGGIYLTVGNMDNTNIITEINVDDNLKVEFPLLINQPSEVILTADTPISGAIISITTGALNIINAPADIILPAGSRLPVKLKMTVPVSTIVPVSIKVPVTIPISETNLHQPLIDLQNVVKPYIFSYMEGSTTIQEIPVCKLFGFICKWWFK